MSLDMKDGAVNIFTGLVNHQRTFQVTINLFCSFYTPRYFLIVKVRTKPLDRVHGK